MAKNRAILVIGLAYGDCGKGSIVDWLVRQHDARLVVRFNGGPQAAHNVVTSDGRHHVFAQFGSGTFVPGVRTLLSRFMLIEPYALFNEAAHLEAQGVPDAWDRLMIDGRCPVITPAHQAANWLRELARGDGPHGSCGMGFGEAVDDLLANPESMLRASELCDPATVQRKLQQIRRHKLHQFQAVIRPLREDPRAQAGLQALLDDSWVAVAVENYCELSRRARVVGPNAVRDCVRGSGTVVCEGAQGVLLDERLGFHPHTTWSDTTFANAESLLDECGQEGPRMRIGVLRSYFTRHGPGPLVSEEFDLAESLPEQHNGRGMWQGHFRAGVFDAVAARYAIAAVGRVDALAVTHLDCLPRLPRHICTAYEHPSPVPDRWFVQQDGRVVALRLPVAAELSELEHRTAIVRHCRPVYTPIDTGDPEAFMAGLQGQLGVPIGIASFGPTDREKRWVRPPDAPTNALAVAQRVRQL